jgi:hypothetical protein
MTIGERKAAANKRRRAFHIYTMSALTALCVGVFTALVFVGLIGPSQWAISRQETILGKVFTGWLTTVNMPAAGWGSETVFISSYTGDTAHLTTGEMAPVADLNLTVPLSTTAEHAVSMNTLAAGLLAAFLILVAVAMWPSYVTDPAQLETGLTGAFEWPTPTTSEKQRQKARKRSEQRREEFAAAQAEADDLDMETQADETQKQEQEPSEGVEFLETRLSEGDTND